MRYTQEQVEALLDALASGEVTAQEFAQQVSELDPATRMQVFQQLRIFGFDEMSAA